MIDWHALRAEMMLVARARLWVGVTDASKDAALIAAIEPVEPVESVEPED